MLHACQIKERRFKTLAAICFRVFNLRRIGNLNWNLKKYTALLYFYLTKDMHHMVNCFLHTRRKTSKYFYIYSSFRHNSHKFVFICFCNVFFFFSTSIITSISLKKNTKKLNRTTYKTKKKEKQEDKKLTADRTNWEVQRRLLDSKKSAQSLKLKQLSN